jgi:hypothetical protein
VWVIEIWDAERPNWKRPLYHESQRNVWVERKKDATKYVTKEEAERDAFLLALSEPTMLGLVEVVKCGSYC